MTMTMEQRKLDEEGERDLGHGHVKRMIDSNLPTKATIVTPPW
jgi:hypothetical protein